MSITDRLLGKKNSNGKPHIDSVSPIFALAGGEVRINGKSLQPHELHRPRVRFGELEGAVVISSDDFVVARVPDKAASGNIFVGANGQDSNPQSLQIAELVANGLHPVTNPAIDRDGNLFVTFSGSRGQKVPVAIFKIDADSSAGSNLKPFVTDMMNPTSMAFDREGQMYVSSRNDEAVYKVSPSGAISTYAEGMGIATGIAFDAAENLYVGDRSGTIFKIARDRQIFVFATLEPSVSAYHIAFGPQGDMFVTAPSTSSFDCVYKVDPHGTVSVFYRGLGRPQGLALDIEGNIYVAASLYGQRGIIKITPQGKAALQVAGEGLVGLAFAPDKSAILAANNSVYRIEWNIEGLPLLP